MNKSIINLNVQIFFILPLVLVTIDAGSAMDENVYLLLIHSTGKYT
jgi:hypothetical protein